MISHRNVIANVLQIGEFEATYRDSLKAPGSQTAHTEVSLCLLPQSHIYCLVVICHSSPFRGDQAVVLPKFDLSSYLASIQNFKISALFLVSNVSPHTKIIMTRTHWLFFQVPPIIIGMLRNHETCSKYDLSSIRSLFTGAAPLGVETAEDFQKLYPNVIVRQGYGEHSFGILYYLILIVSRSD